MGSLHAKLRLGALSVSLLAISAGHATALQRTLNVSLSGVDGARVRVQQQIRNVWLTLGEKQSRAGRASVRFESGGWDDIRIAVSSEERNLEMRRGFQPYQVTKQLFSTSPSTRIRSSFVTATPELRGYSSFFRRFGSSSRLRIELRGSLTVRVDPSLIELGPSDLTPNHIEYAMAVVDLARESTLASGLRVNAPNRIGVANSSHPVEEGLVIWHAKFPEGRTGGSGGGKNPKNVAILLANLSVPPSSIRSRLGAKVRARPTQTWQSALQAMFGLSESRAADLLERSRIDPLSDFYTGRPPMSTGGSPPQVTTPRAVAREVQRVATSVKRPSKDEVKDSLRLPR